MLESTQNKYKPCAFLTKKTFVVSEGLDSYLVGPLLIP